MWRCKNCDSPDVEMLDWVDMNSGEEQDDVDLDEYYCRNCGTQVEVYFEIDEEN